MIDDKYLKEEFVNVEPVGNDLRPSDKLSVGDACKELKHRTKPPEYHWERWKTKAGHCDCLDCREYRAELYLKTHERNEELTCPHQDEQHRWCEIHALPFHRDLEECADCRDGKPRIEQVKPKKQEEQPLILRADFASSFPESAWIIPPGGMQPRMGYIVSRSAICDSCGGLRKTCKCNKEKR